MEVRLMIERKIGRARWHETRQKLSRLHNEMAPADQPLAESAGEIKVANKILLADCVDSALENREMSRPTPTIPSSEQSRKKSRCCDIIYELRSSL
jgi:hypothetical protein